MTKITSSETTDDVAVLVANLALLVDTHARHGVDATLLLFRFPALGLANDVAVLVVDVAIFVNLVSLELLDVALGNTTDDFTRRCLNGAVFGDSCVVETSKWTLRARLLTMDKLSKSDDVTFVVPNLALTINLLAGQGSWVTLGNASENGSTGINNIASLVDSAAGKSAEVDFLFDFFFL